MTSTGDPTSDAGPSGSTGVRVKVGIVMGGLADPTPPVVLQVRWLVLPRRPATLLLNFSREMDRARVEDMENYVLLEPSNRPIGIAGAFYNAIGRSAVLFPCRRLSPRRSYRLRISGASPDGLTDSEGHLLDGLGDGSAGSDYATILCAANLVSASLGGARAGTAAPVAPRPLARPAPDAIDAALRAEARRRRYRVVTDPVAAYESSP